MVDEILIETLKKVIVQEIKDYLEDNAQSQAEYSVYEEDVKSTVRDVINDELEVQVRNL